MRAICRSIGTVAVIGLAFLTLACSQKQEPPPAVSGSSTPASSSSPPPLAPPQHAVKHRPSNVAMLPVTRETVREIQTALQRDNFYSGPIDGMIGPSTRKAITAYQRQHGLPQSAALDWPTLQQLASAAQPGNAPAATSGSSSPPPSTNSAPQSQPNTEPSQSPQPGKTP
jgi:peptidoglycan hydrolase-like protein with peptidoglycan-binding domain